MADSIRSKSVNLQSEVNARLCSIGAPLRASQASRSNRPIRLGYARNPLGSAWLFAELIGWPANYNPLPLPLPLPLPRSQFVAPRASGSADDREALLRRARAGRVGSSKRAAQHARHVRVCGSRGRRHRASVDSRARGPSRRAPGWQSKLLLYLEVTLSCSIIPLIVLY